MKGHSKLDKTLFAAFCTPCHPDSDPGCSRLSRARAGQGFQVQVSTTSSSTLRSIQLLLSICIQHRQKEQKIEAYYVAFRLPKLEGKGGMVISLCFSLLSLPRSFFAFSSSPLCVSKLVRCAFSEREKEREERKRERERRCVEEVKFGVRVRQLQLIRDSLTFQVSMKLPSADSLWGCSNEAVS